MKKNIVIISLVLIILSNMIINPKSIFIASSTGVTTWATVLVPSLFPFLVIVSLLMKLGVVNFLGVLFEPLMRPLFNVSGAGGFIMAIGFTSGFPISSLLTADLRLQGKLTKNEAERLMSFTNNSSPLFIFSAISIGMFNYPLLGYSLALGHYLSNIIIGLVLGFFSPKEHKHVSNHRLLSRAFSTLNEVPQLPIGKLIGDAIDKAIKSILAIGGFVILFSIIIATCNNLQLFVGMNYLFSLPLRFFGYDPNLALPLSIGFFEVTLGVKEVTETSAAFYQQVVIAAIILAWNGLSIHAQVANFVSKTDIKLTTFLYTRIAQSFLAPIITLFFFHKYETTSTNPYKVELIEQLFLASSPFSWFYYSGLTLIVLLVILMFFSMLAVLVEKCYN